jgi:DNA polymerase III epsilon subunit-like protein
MYLVFDSTPISKPLSYKAPFSDTFAWPRLMHLSWILLDDKYKLIEDFDCIVSPDGFELSDRILEFCKLDNEDIEKKAVPVTEILKQFSESVEKSFYLVAHNMNMNECVLSAEYLRNSIPNPIFKKERICLMQESTYYCKIPSKSGGFKWPSLTELHAVCFNQKYSPSGNARADVIAAARSFIKLMKLNALEDFFDED